MSLGAYVVDGESVAVISGTCRAGDFFLDVFRRRARDGSYVGFAEAYVVRVGAFSRVLPVGYGSVGGYMSRMSGVSV